MNEEANQDRPKKIIVDEDWKTQVQAERDQIQKDTNTATAPTSDDQPSYELPPPSFPFLVTSLATQAMAALGQIPDPLENKAVVRLDLAKHHIDTLAILQEKTKGNLTADEAQMLESVVHQLRMAFVAIQQQ